MLRPNALSVCSMCFLQGGLTKTLMQSRACSLEILMAHLSGGMGEVNPRGKKKGESRGIIYHFMAGETCLPLLTGPDEMRPTKKLVSGASHSRKEIFFMEERKIFPHCRLPVIMSNILITDQYFLRELCVLGMDLCIHLPEYLPRLKEEQITATK